MDYKIGKIIKYDGFYGEIAEKDNIYFFLKEDINNIGEIYIDQLVIFRGEKIENKYRAFFVTKKVV